MTDVDKKSYEAINTEIKYNFPKKIEEFEEWPEPAPVIGYRHLQCLLYFILCLIAFGLRIILSVAIIAMTDPTISSNPDIPTYPDWKDKNVILSAFFWGYVLPQAFAGWAANRFGAKWFLISIMFVQSILGVLTPYTAAAFGSKGLIISRALQGFCQGFIFPSLTHLLSQWAPTEERSRLGSFVLAAGPFGTVIALLITGPISASWYGWPLVFYLYGCCGFVWCVLMIVLGYNTPAIHPRISKAEKFYIEKSLGHTEEKVRYPTPWKQIFTSIPAWALCAAQCGNNYGFWTLVTQIPTYMNSVMNFNIKKNSLLSALPYLTLWILNFVFSFTSDGIINKNLVTRNFGRKLFNSIGLLIPAIALIFLGYTNAEKYIQAVILLIIAVGANAACFSGWAINHIDLTPNHAGTLMGIINGFSNIGSALAPIVVQLVVTNEKDISEWRVVFFITAGFNIITAIIFDLFGSAEVQPWNNLTDDDNGEDDKEKN